MLPRTTGKLVSRATSHLAAKANYSVLLNCIFFNARSINNKLHEFYDLLSGSAQQLYDIVMVTETWLKTSILNSLILNNHNNNIFRWDRTNTTGGGVCILVCKLFEATLVTIPDEFSTAELVAVDVQLNDVKQRFVCC